MQANRDNSLYLRKAKGAHWLWPVLGNQPNLNAALNALPWETRPSPPRPARSAAAGSRPAPSASCPHPPAPGSRTRAQALLIERYVTYKKKGQWHTRAEAVLYLTSLGADETTPEDLLAHVRGHWRVENCSADCTYE